MLTNASRILAVLIAGVTLATVLHAQTGPPPSVNYQAVARKADGTPIAGQDIGIRFRITTDTVALTTVYTETHRVTTDDLGLFTVLLGRGSTSDVFTSIQWGTRPYWLVVYLDPDAAGPQNEILMGWQEIVAVPMAIRAEVAQRADSAQTVRGFYIGRGVAYADGDSLRYMDVGAPGTVLTSTGSARPEWRSIEAVVTETVIDSVTTRVLRDTVFLRNVSDEVRKRLTNDSTLIRDIIADPELRAFVLRYVDSVLAQRPIYDNLRDSLLRDRAFLDGIASDTILQRIIADDPVFVDRLFANERFTTLLRSAIGELELGLEGRYWKRRGDAGSNASTDFIGTTDAQSFVVRTNNIERWRVTEQGAVGINTPSPTATLDVNGPMNLRGAFRTSSNAGLPGMVLRSAGPLDAPTWTSTLDGLTLITPSISGATFTGPTVFNGPTSFATLPTLPLGEGALMVGLPTNVAGALLPGTEGQVLRMVGGRPTWGTIDVQVNARNGLGVNAGYVELGGALTRATTIDLNGRDLSMTGAVGNVGIGQLFGGPTERLHVGGNLRIDGSLRPNGLPGSTGQVLISQGANIAPVWTSTLASMTLVNTSLSGTTSVTGPTSFSTNVTFAQLPTMPLAQGAMLYGNGSNVAVPLSIGTEGQVLSVVGGLPTWRDMAAMVSASNGLTALGTNIRLGGTLTQATTIVLNGFDLAFGGASGNVIIGNVVGPVTDRLVVGGSLRIDGALRPNGNAGTSGQILVSQGASAPTWTSSLSGLTITSSTISNSTITASTLNGPTTFNGSASFAALPSMPLAQHAMLVGNASGIASPLPGGSSGQVLAIVGGAPTWTNVSGIISASNGVSMSGSTVELGGVLTKATSIGLAGQALQLTGASGSIVMGGSGAGSSTTVGINTNGSGATTIGNASSSTTIAGPVQMTALAPMSSTTVVGMQGTQLGQLALVAGQGINVTPSVGSITIASTNAPLSNGTVTNATTRWNGSAWVENANVLSTAGGDVTINGNTSIGNAPTDVHSIVGITTINGGLSTAPTIIGSQFNTTRIDGPLELASANNGTSMKVLTLSGPTVTSSTLQAGAGILLVPTPGVITVSSTSAPVGFGTTTNSTLRWNGSMWVENVNVQTTPSGDVNVNGSTNLGSAAPATSTLTVSGSMANAIRTVAGSVVVTNTDYCIIVNNAAAASVQLPSAVGITGRNYIIKRAAGSTQSVVVTTTGGQTIDGLPNYRINTNNGRITLISDGVNWQVIDAY